MIWQLSAFILEANYIDMKRYIPIAIILVILTSCSRKHTTYRYEELSADHSIIAVLPFYNHYTGRIPEKLTEEELDEIRTDEAYIFQQALYFQLLDKSGMDDDHIRIDIQDVSMTNALLDKAGISPLEVSKRPTQEISSILGVDAVVRVDLYKNQFLSNNESFAIHSATKVLMNTTDIKLPWNADKGGEVRILSKLLDSEKGVALWSYQKKYPIDWSSQTDDVVDKQRHLKKVSLSKQVVTLKVMSRTKSG